MKACMELLHSHSIQNISLDLLYSLPSQTMSQLKTSLYDALSLHPAHLSLYSLTIEENTVFAKKGYEHLDERIFWNRYAKMQNRKDMSSMKYPISLKTETFLFIISVIGNTMISSGSAPEQAVKKMAAGMIIPVPSHSIFTILSIRR